MTRELINKGKKAEKKVMGLLGKLIKHTVSLPLNVIKDVVTLGGALHDEESALQKQLREFKKDMDDE